VIRTFAALCAVACLVAAAGCGGGGGSSSGGSAPETVAIVPGTSDYGVGVNRVSFLIVDKQSRLIERPTARVQIARGLKEKPFAETTAKLVPIGVPGGAKADAQNVYVASVETSAPGTYWLFAEPTGGRRIEAIGNMVVHRHSAAPEVGDRAIPSRNPTLGPGVDPKLVTTAKPLDRILLRTTVAAAMAAKRPFVVTFATPLYCQSRTCGPVVDVVQSVAKTWRGKGVDFIHIEIYKNNDPAQGTNRWVDQWRLKSEPFTFIVDKTGVIRTRLEGAFSAAELEAAVRGVAS
jgi:hypothetical protein